MHKYISLNQAIDLLPIRPAISTIYRWCTCGHTINGTKEAIQLEHVYIGRRLFTTEQWLEDFITRCKAARQAAQEKRRFGKPDRYIYRYLAQAEADIILRKAGI
jgi:hypothetical protein